MEEHMTLLELMKWLLMYQSLSHHVNRSYLMNSADNLAMVN